MILVIGATGHVGRQVVAQLTRVGAPVRALVRDPAEAALPAGVEIVRGDLLRPETVEPALRGVDAVFVVWPFRATDAAPAVLDVVARSARHVVYLSSIGAGPDKTDPIPFHAEVERLIEASGLDWTFLRGRVDHRRARPDVPRMGGRSRKRLPLGLRWTAPCRENGLILGNQVPLRGNSLREVTDRKPPVTPSLVAEVNEMCASDGESDVRGSHVRCAVRAWALPGQEGDRTMDQTGRQVISRASGQAPAWHQDAACAQVGGDWWFPDDPHERISGPVLRICADCPVRRSCLLFALSVDVLHGVWAGMVPAELWALRQRVLDGEPAASVVADGLATGDARRTNREGVAYRAAPWNPAIADLDQQIELVARWTVADDAVYEAGSPAA